MKHSLNISVAAGIVLWELVRLRLEQQPGAQNGSSSIQLT
jgi:hypothetical protein